jgi:hypothetical protein
VFAVFGLALPWAMKRPKTRLKLKSKETRHVLCALAFVFFVK